MLCKVLQVMKSNEYVELYRHLNCISIAVDSVCFSTPDFFKCHSVFTASLILIPLRNICVHAEITKMDRNVIRVNSDIGHSV